MDTPALPAPTPAARRVPKKIKAACEAIVTGQAKSITDAATAAGISREYFSRQLSKSHVAEYLRQKAARTVAIASGRASARIGELIDADSEHVSLDASVRTLAIAGISAVQTNVNLNFHGDMPKAGYVIDLRDERDSEPAPRIIDVTPIKPANNSAG
jgi:hypothetical protein